MTVFCSITPCDGVIPMGRLQSADPMVEKRIFDRVNNGKLYMGLNAYRAYGEPDSVIATPSPLDHCKKGEFCLLSGQDTTPFKDKISRIVVFRWKKNSPSTRFFRLFRESGWIVESEDSFFSKEGIPITETVYIRQ